MAGKASLLFSWGTQDCRQGATVFPCLCSVLSGFEAQCIATAVTAAKVAPWGGGCKHTMHHSTVNRLWSCCLPTYTHRMLALVTVALCNTSAAPLIFCRTQEVAAFSQGGWTPTDMGSSEGRLQDVVYHSFSKLIEAAQNMFLDSVSVLQGQPVSKAMLVWDVWWPDQAHQALRRLKQLSLISTKTTRYSNSDPPSILDERLLTLDVIRVLGQSIIRKHDRDDRLGGTYVGSRVWFGSGHEVQGLIQVRPLLHAMGPCIVCMYIR